MGKSGFVLIAVFCLFAGGCRKHARVSPPPPPAPAPAAIVSPPPPPPPAPVDAVRAPEQPTAIISRPSRAKPPESGAPAGATGAVPELDRPTRPRRSSGTRASAIAAKTQIAGDASRPRKIVLLDGTAGPGQGAFHLDAPPLRQGENGRFRLLIDPKPLFAANGDEYRQKLAIPGITDGAPTAFAPSMEAVLTGSPNLQIRAEDPAQKDLDTDLSTEWFWNVTPSSAGQASVRLDVNSLTASGKKENYPFPVHSDFQVAGQAVEPAKPVTAASSSQWILWAVGALLLLLLIAAALWILWRKRKKPVAVRPASFAGTPGFERAILLRDDRYLVVMNIQVIHHADDALRAQAICRDLADDRYRFHFGLEGFPAGSARWQAHFHDSLAACDAALAVLSVSALGDKGVNWQLEQTLNAQRDRELPIYAAVLDDRVMEVARTVSLLEGMKYYRLTPDGQKEIRSLLLSGEPAPLRLLRCFISYSHLHRDFSNRLCTDLNNAGIRTWMDVEGIPGGSTWKLKIAEAIDSSTHVLFVLTAESVKSEQVSAEIDWAQQKKKIIVPVMENEVDLPFGLLGTQYVSFTAGYDAGFRKLLYDLSLSGASISKPV